MDTNRINGLPLANPNLIDKFQGSNRAQDRQGRTLEPSGQPEQLNSPQVADRAEISETGRKLVDLRRNVDAGRAAIAALPEVREQKLAQVRARLERGDYEAAEVRAQVAARLENVIKGMDQA